MKRMSLLSALLVVLTACIAQPSEPPVIQLKSPEDGVEVSLGERVLVQSVAQDDKGVVKTELWVDGRLYESHRSGAAQGQRRGDQAMRLTAQVASMDFECNGRIAGPAAEH